MEQYPKKILNISEQLQAYKEAGMIISSDEEVYAAMRNIGYYRLRGYCFHLYDNATKKYHPGTSFSNILKLYNFDKELSMLLFSMITSIEIALRARLSNALLVYNDALILTTPVIFSDKKLFWKNLSSLASQVRRSNEVFINHHFKKYDGQIPFWAAVEVMSFGTLSKTIKNLKTEDKNAYQILASYYRFPSPKGRLITPTLQMLSSWIQAVSTLRNMCAHNSRIYNRSINTRPQLLKTDITTANPRYTGLYQILLAMKYLRPTDEVWRNFCQDLQNLFEKYDDCIDISRMNFPENWKAHIFIA